MNSIKKTMKKGFTLVELIVVMAVMSILLVAVMSMTEPATRIMKRTSMSETAYSMANNAETYIRRTLDYADAVWIADSDSVDADGNKLIEPGATDPCLSMVKKFQKAYYEKVAMPTVEGANGKLKFVQGNIYVMCLDNSTGKISVSKYHYKNSSSDTMDLPVTTEVLPDAYFKGDGAKYNIRYALGSSQLEIVNDGSGDKRNDSNDPFYNLKSEKDGLDVSPTGSNAKDQNITIIVNKGGKPSAPAADQPTEFEGPAVASVAPLSFTNIRARAEGSTGQKRPKRYIITADEADDFTTQESSISTDSTYSYNFSTYGYEDAFVSFPGKINITGGAMQKVSTQRNIYFVYAYADELQPHA